jgi:hypothetical protein
MVKNTGGGNRAKKFASKNVSNNSSYKKIRLPTDSDEIFAVVRKLYGGAELSVLSIDGVERRCIMRKKFRGRYKRDNHVKMGTWVLIGLRNYHKTHTIETTSKGKQKLEVCDLMEVYNESEVREIKETIDIDFGKLMTEDEYETHDDIKFVDDDSYEVEQTIKAETYETVKLETNEVVIDVDDI